MSAFRSKVLPWKNLRLENLQGLIYGGTTQTFLKNKKAIAKKMADEKRFASYSMPHFDMRKSNCANLARSAKPKKAGNRGRRPSGCLGSTSPRAAPEAEMFYAWECLSLVRKDGSTFDLVVCSVQPVVPTSIKFR